MLPACQIVGFLNQLFFQNELMKQPQCVDTNLQKLKVDQKRFG